MTNLQKQCFHTRRNMQAEQTSRLTDAQNTWSAQHGTRRRGARHSEERKRAVRPAARQGARIAGPGPCPSARVQAAERITVQRRSSLRAWRLSCWTSTS